MVSCLRWLSACVFNYGYYFVQTTSTRRPVRCANVGVFFFGGGGHFLRSVSFTTFIHLGETVFRHAEAAPPTASTRYPPIVARPTREKLLHTGQNK